MRTLAYPAACDPVTRLPFYRACPAPVVLRGEADNCDIYFGRPEEARQPAGGSAETARHPHEVRALAADHLAIMGKELRIRGTNDRN